MHGAAQGTRLCDKGEVLLQLAGRVHRTCGTAKIEGVADFHGIRRFDQQVCKLLLDRPFHQQTRACNADLTRVAEDACC